MIKNLDIITQKKRIFLKNKLWQYSNYIRELRAQGGK